VYTFFCTSASVVWLVPSGKRLTGDGMAVRLKVKEVAKERGFSMGRLSRTSNVAYNTIKRIYDEKNYSPTMNTMMRIAKALDVSIADLVEEVPDE
jgi:DNA-binding Xre family transcriptional regulator